MCETDGIGNTWFIRFSCLGITWPRPLVCLPHQDVVSEACFWIKSKDNFCKQLPWTLELPHIHPTSLFLLEQNLESLPCWSRQCLLQAVYWGNFQWWNDLKWGAALSDSQRSTVCRESRHQRLVPRAFLKTCTSFSGCYRVGEGVQVKLQMLRSVPLASKFWEWMDHAVVHNTDVALAQDKTPFQKAFM